jgi:hypothetical protein
MTISQKNLRLLAYMATSGHFSCPSVQGRAWTAYQSYGPSLFFSYDFLFRTSFSVLEHTFPILELPFLL